MDKSENCLFDVICKVVVVICFFIMTITMISLNHKMSTYIQEYEHQFNVYQNLVKEYHETPSSYNQMTIYDKIKVFEDNLK